MPPDNAALPNSGEMSEEDKMAAEWAAALAESSPASSATEVQTTETVAPAAFTNFSSGASPTAGNDINMIPDIPGQLTVELGRKRIPIQHIPPPAPGSGVGLPALAGRAVGRPG